MAFGHSHWPILRYSIGTARSFQLRNSPRPILIASRRSQLARRQAQLIGQTLGRLNPHVCVEYKWLDTIGDLNSSSNQWSHAEEENNKDQFVSTVEKFLLDGGADIAVHSAKDLPATGRHDGLAITAIPRRGDVRDCLISKNGATCIEDLSHSATIGTNSPRRAAQMLRLRSDLQINPLRGNVETRLQRVLDDHAHDATLLACAGLRRLDLHEHLAATINLTQILPAAGQGALAVQCRVDDHVTIRRCLPLNDSITSAAVHAEREIVCGLGANCHSPVAVLVEPIGDRGVDGFSLRVRALAPDGSKCLEFEGQASSKQLGKMTKQALASLNQRGARQIMSSPSVFNQVPTG